MENNQKTTKEKKMKLTQKQTDKILQKLRDYNLEVIDTDSKITEGAAVVSEEYFWEKVNEALEKEK